MSEHPSAPPLLALVLALLSAAAAPAQPGHHQDREEGSPILAYYDFEEPVPSGPDTFWVRDRRGNRIDLSRAYRVSGERSLAVQEASGNGDFAEFLGYFDERKDGAVFIQFYVLFTDTKEKFNFGLAGPGWFLSRGKDGHAVWLETSEGKLWHYPAYQREELFTPVPFEWYFIDLVYHVDRGTYDIAVFEESCGEKCSEPLLDRRGFRNTCDHDFSSVRYFSFIGDLEDTGRFSYFVDDLLVATDPSVRLKPFVAPGRRRYFVEMFAGGRPALADAAREDLLWEARQWLASPRPKSGPDGKTAEWLERAGDEAFFAGELELALDAFSFLATDESRSVRMRLKLADVYHEMGNVAEEQRLREAIYGSLAYEELK